jgi:hypothetical protein
LRNEIVKILKELNMYRNFDFTKSFDPEVIGDLNRAEDYLYVWGDPHGCMLKVGAAIENLVVNDIVGRESLLKTFEAKPSLKKCVELLDKIETCPRKVIQAIDYIRKRRNRANHEGWRKEYDAHECLKQAHRILNWCVEQDQIYGGKNSEN